MPARIALGHTAGWEFPLAVVIELAAIAWTASLAARIYQGALVRGGARLSWAEALRAS
jgi:ABC-2 type transport system permease protein